MTYLYLILLIHLLNCLYHQMDLLLQIANAIIRSDKHPECRRTLPQNQGAPWTQESDYRCVSYAPDRYLERTFKAGALLCQGLSCR